MATTYDVPPLQQFVEDPNITTFEDALRAYAIQCRDVDKSYLCAWNPWQKAAKELRPHYSDAPASDDLSRMLSSLRVKLCDEVFGREPGPLSQSPYSSCWPWGQRQSHEKADYVVTLRSSEEPPCQ